MERAFLNSRQVKELAGIVMDQWGAPFPDDCFVLQRKDGDVFIVQRSVAVLALDALRPFSFGLYIGELRGGDFRLSIEGAQLFGPQATRNVVKISDAQMRQWFRGEDLDRGGALPGHFVILKHGQDFVGCGKVTQGNILNFVPKARRISADA